MNDNFLDRLYGRALVLAHHKVISSTVDAVIGVSLLYEQSNEGKNEKNNPELLRECGNHLVTALEILVESVEAGEQDTEVENEYRETIEHMRSMFA